MPPGVVVYWVTMNQMLWLLAGTVVLWTMWASPLLTRSLFRRSAGPGQCACCKYDLTGNTSGVCPECGVAVKKLSEGVV